MISIHAPARGATPQHFAVHSLFEISIHAPARGATRNGDRETNASGNFNPRSREGSDKNAGGHVLAELHFNPRSREGSDALHFVLRHMIHISIHAPARGATSLASALLVAVIFQSTLPRGERISSRRLRTCTISIHAPARGATSSHHNSAYPFSHFNPRSREGSDCIY